MSRELVLDREHEAIYQTQMEIDDKAKEIIDANFTSEEQAELDAQFEFARRQDITFVDVTLRDGLQQEDVDKGSYDAAKEKYTGLEVEQRIEIFDALVEMGVEQVEIGHLGNEEDRPFAEALVQHINKKAETDDRYAKVKLQVLFGAIPSQIEEGMESLNGFDKDRVVVHVYSRISPGLRKIMGDISPEESAQRVIDTADVALANGFTHFSVSGEGAVDHNQRQSVVIDYHNRITEHLFDNGATDVNVNLANTFGSGMNGEWTPRGMRKFNDAVKAVADYEKYQGQDKKVTTSIHTHNDFYNAVEIAYHAVHEGGFDKVEIAEIGMGERAGNTAGIDLRARFLEEGLALQEIIAREAALEAEEDEFVVEAIAQSIFGRRRLSGRIMAGLQNGYNNAERIGEIAGTARFMRTAVGNPNAMIYGSGPHGEGAFKHIEDPLTNPTDNNYGRSAFIYAMLGHSVAMRLVEDADPTVRKELISLNHAAGGKVKAAHHVPEEGEAEKINPAPQPVVDAHRIVVENRQEMVKNIVGS
jgi:isopropylmalate/homocitrate/citramalate synthase